MKLAPAIRSSLQGRRVLVVEDEYMIAVEIAEILTEAGALTLGPLPSVSDAQRSIAGGEPIDCALLDVNVGGHAIWPAVEALLARKVPIVLATGYDASAIPKMYGHLPRCEKPASAQDLTRALVRALDGAAASGDRPACGSR